MTLNARRGGAGTQLQDAPKETFYLVLGPRELWSSELDSAIQPVTSGIQEQYWHLDESDEAFHTSNEVSIQTPSPSLLETSAAASVARSSPDDQTSSSMLGSFPTPETRTVALSFSAFPSKATTEQVAFPNKLAQDTSSSARQTQSPEQTLRVPISRLATPHACSLCGRTFVHERHARYACTQGCPHSCSAGSAKSIAGCTSARTTSHMPATRAISDIQPLTISTATCVPSIQRLQQISWCIRAICAGGQLRRATTAAATGTQEPVGSDAMCFEVIGAFYTVLSM